MSGLYVAFEGIDGAGKTTVAASVADRLRGAGREVVFVREPGGTETGEAVRSVLLHGSDLTPWAEALLFAAARAQLAVEVIGPALERGAVVVADRSVYSSLAYQGHGRGLGVDLVQRVNAAGLGGVWPDLVVVLDVDAATGLEREDESDRISTEGEDLQRRVGEAYRELVAADPERVVLIDAGRPLASVLDAASAVVESRL